MSMDIIKRINKESFLYGLSAGIFLSTLFFNRNFFNKERVKDDMVYMITRSIPINKKTFLEFGIKDGQYFRIVDKDNYVIVNSKKIIKTIETDDKIQPKVVYMLEDDYLIVFSTLEQSVKIEIYHGNHNLYVSLLLQDPKIEKISLYSRELDKISDFLTKNIY